MAASNAVFKGFTRFASAMLRHSELAERTREVAILRIGAVVGSQYEWRRHVLIGRAKGLTDAEITDVKSAVFDSLSTEERIAAVYAEAVETRTVDDYLMRELKALFSESQIVELTMLCAMYSLVCRFLLALDVNLDEDIASLDTP
jgi:alkylhydroperoxidase family enzyme